MPCLRLRKAAFPAHKATWQASRGREAAAHIPADQNVPGPLPLGPQAFTHTASRHPEGLPWSLGSWLHGPKRGHSRWVWK